MCVCVFVRVYVVVIERGGGYCQASKQPSVGRNQSADYVATKQPEPLTILKRRAANSYNESQRDALFLKFI